MNGVAWCGTMLQWTRWLVEWARWAPATVWVVEYHSLQRVTQVTWRDTPKRIVSAFWCFNVPALFLVLLSILLLPSLSNVNWIGIQIFPSSQLAFICVLVAWHCDICDEIDGAQHVRRRVQGRNLLLTIWPHWSSSRRWEERRKKAYYYLRCEYRFI